MKIHHIGYIVEDHEKSQDILQRFGFRIISEKILSKSQNVYISLLEKDKIVIELISSVGPSSPVYNLLEKIGPSPYHLCFEVENLNESLRFLVKIGFKQVTKIFYAEVFGNKRAVFLYSTQIGLVELIEKGRVTIDES